MKRRPPDSARRCFLPIGIVIGEKQAQRLRRAGMEIGSVPLKGFHPRNVDIAEVERPFAVLHPLGKRHARPAGGLDADGVEPRRDPDIVHARCQAEMIGIVRREAFRPVEESVDAGARKDRHPVYRLLEYGRDMVEIIRKLIEFEILGNAVHAPGLCLRFESTHQDFACVFLVIGAFVRHAQHRKRAKIGNGFRHDVEMLAGVKRHIDARHPAHIARPHAGAIDDRLAGDMPFVSVFVLPVDTRDASSLGGHAGDFDLLMDACALLLRTTRQRQCDIAGIALSVFRQINARQHPVEIEMGIARADLGRRDFLDFNAESARHSSGTQQLFAPVFGKGDGDRAGAFEAGGKPRLRLQRAVEFLRIFREPRHVCRRAQLRDEPCGMPGRAACQLLALQQHDIAPAEPGEVIGDGASRDTATDNDDAGPVLNARFVLYVGQGKNLRLHTLGRNSGLAAFKGAAIARQIHVGARSDQHEAGSSRFGGGGKTEAPSHLL